MPFQLLTLQELEALSMEDLSKRVKVLTCELQALYRRNDELRRMAAEQPARARELAQDAAKLMSRASEIQREHDAVQALLERQTAPTN